MPIFKKAAAKKAEEVSKRNFLIMISKKPGSGYWSENTINVIAKLREMGVSDEKLNEIADKAIASKMQFTDVMALDECTPEQREKTLQDAKKYKIPIYQLAEFNRRFVTDDERTREVVLKEAEKIQVDPIDIVKGMIDLRKRREKEKQ